MRNQMIRFASAVCVASVIAIANFGCGGEPAESDDAGVIALDASSSDALSIDAALDARGSVDVGAEADAVVEPSDHRFPPAPSSLGTLSFTQSVYRATTFTPFMPAVVARTSDGSEIPLPEISLYLLDTTETAFAAGDTVLSVRDGVIRIGVGAPGFSGDHATVIIGAAAPPGVVSVEFADFAMRVGERVELADVATAYAADGTEAPLAGVTFRAEGGLTVEGDQLVAGSVGSSSLIAEVAGLRVGFRSVPVRLPTDSALLCEWTIVPLKMWTGQTTVVRPIVRREVDRGGFRELVNEYGVSELSLRAESRPVVTSVLEPEFVGFTGQLAFAADGGVLAAAAGWSDLSAQFELSDGVIAACEPYVVEIAEDTAGTWSYSCANGAEGVLRDIGNIAFPVTGAPPLVRDRPATLTQFGFSGSRSNGCSGDGERCEGEASLTTVGPGFTLRDCQDDSVRGGAGSSRTRIAYRAAGHLQIDHCEISVGDAALSCDTGSDAGIRFDAGPVCTDAGPPPASRSVVLMDVPALMGRRAFDADRTTDGMCVSDPYDDTDTRTRFSREATRMVYTGEWEGRSFDWGVGSSECEYVERPRCDGVLAIESRRCTGTDQHGNHYETEFDERAGTGTHRWTMNPDCWGDVDGEAALQEYQYVCGNGVCEDPCATAFSCLRADRALGDYFVRWIEPGELREICSSDCEP